MEASTHYTPFEPECINDSLHSLYHPVVLTADTLTTLDLGALWTIEHQQRQKGRAHKSRASEEQSTQLWVLAFMTVGRMEEPNARVDADAKASDTVRGGLEPIHDGEVSERPCLSSRTENLSE